MQHDTSTNQPSSSRHRLDRRTFLGTSAATTAALIASTTSAQDASPQASPAASPAGSSIKSMTRQEYQSQLAASQPFEEPGSQGGQLVYSQTSDLRTVNPILLTDTYSGIITGLVFQALSVASAIDGTQVPELCDYWEVADDQVTYTFHLPQNVMWHDGTPFTADDVVFSFDATLAEDSLSVRRSGVMLALDSYRAIDDHTVELVSKAPLASFVGDTTGLIPIVPRHIWQDVPFGEWGSDAGSTGQDASRVIGTGPFKFVEWITGERASVVKNPDYWDADNMPVIDEFIYQVIADAASVIASLQTGQTDMCEVQFGQANALMESNPELTVIANDSASFNYYYANQDPAKSGIFTDMAVRQALMYAIDRDLVAETTYDGFAIRAVGTQPVLSIAYRPDDIVDRFDYDPNKAMEVLDGAGWVDADGDGIRDKDGTKLSFELFYSEGAATYEQQIPYMQEAWRAIGVEMIASALPFPALVENAIAGNFDMCVAGFGWGFDGSQGDMFRSSATPPNGFNRMHYSNAEYDELDEKQARELDVEKRIGLLTDQTNIVTTEQAAGIMLFRQNIMGNGPRVHNFFPNGYSTFWSMNQVWVDPIS